jgi:hypothetical protein
LGRDRAQGGRRHGRALDPNRERDRQALEARERGDDGRRRGFPVELASGPARHDLRLEPAEPKRGVAVSLVDLTRELADDEVECRLVDLGRRMNVCAEDPHADPAQAAEGAEAVALAASGLHARLPVDFHAELARPHLPRAPGGAELDRHVAEPVSAALEAHAGLVRVQAAHGDAGDLRAGWQLGGRAGKGEAEERADADEHCSDEQ